MVTYHGNPCGDFPLFHSQQELVQVNYQPKKSKLERTVLYVDCLDLFMEMRLSLSEQKVLFWLMFNPGCSKLDEIAAGINRSRALVVKGMKRLKAMRVISRVDGRYYVHPSYCFPAYPREEGNKEKFVRKGAISHHKGYPIPLPNEDATIQQIEKEGIIRDVEEGFTGEEIHTAWACEPPF